MITPPSFGSFLRRLRVAAGLTQDELAERARMSKRGLQDLELGASQRPRQSTLTLLSAALELSTDERSALLAAARARPLPLASPGAVAAPALCGRAEELALLDRFLDGMGTSGEAAPVLLLAGEPGIGKTRLLQAAVQRAEVRGWCVLMGGCQRRGGQRPYTPLLDAVAQHLQSMRPAERHAALVGCSWLVRLLPELAEAVEPLPAGILAPKQEQRLIHAAVARLLANVAGPVGMLLVLDDLQWAGPDALDLIDTLARAPAPTRIIGAYRDTEVRPAEPLGLLLADLAQARLARQHALGPLDATEAAALLQALLSDAPASDDGLVGRVLQRTGGVPFFLVSYAQALHQGSAEEVPWDLAQGVRQRVALLPAPGQEILETAAVVGRRASRDVLAAVAGQPEEGVLAGLEAACRARLLLEEGEDAYAFAHDVIREVVEAEVGTARRAVLHRRVAEALELEPSGVAPEVLAYHYARAGAQDKAVRYLEQAGDHAWSQCAHGAAEGHYRETLERLERLGRMQDALRVREKLGEVLFGAGRYEAALAVLERAAETYVAGGDLESLVRVTAAMGWAHRFRGTTVEGIAQLTALMERLERGGVSPPPLATLYLPLGWLLFAAGQYDASLAAGERAAALARAQGDDRTLALAEAHRVNILQMQGRLHDALRVGREALPLAERAGDLTCLVGTHADVAYIHALQGAFATGRRSLDQAVAHAEQVGNPTLLLFILAVRGWIAVLSGEWTDAHTDLDRAASVSSQADRSWYSAYVSIFQARLALAEGAWTGASAALQEALGLAEASRDLQALRLAATTMAELEIQESRPEAARARLLPLLDRPGLEECDVTTLLPVLAWAYLEQGQVEQAAATVAQALSRARPEGMRLVLVEALRVRALIALRRERWDEAAESLEEGLALARGMPYPYAEARLLLVAGALHAQRGDPAAACERLETARAIFARLGAREDAARVEQSLAACLNDSPSVPRG